MSLLAQRLNLTVVTETAKKEYSVEGAVFQEKAIAHITAENKANNPIGRLVTAINNNQISVSEANAQFNGWLGYQAL